MPFAIKTGERLTNFRDGTFFVCSDEDACLYTTLDQAIRILIQNPDPVLTTLRIVRAWRRESRTVRQVVPLVGLVDHDEIRYGVRFVESGKFLQGPGHGETVVPLDRAGLWDYPQYAFRAVVTRGLDVRNAQLVGIRERHVDGEIITEEIEDIAPPWERGGESGSSSATVTVIPGEMRFAVKKVAND